MTRTGKSPRLSGHHAEPFVQLHPLDAARFGLTFGDLAEVRTADGADRRAARDHGHRDAGAGVRADALGQRVREQRARRRVDRAGRRSGLGAAGAQDAPGARAPLRAEVVRLRAVARAALAARLVVSRTCRAAPATGATSSPARSCRRRGPSGPTALLGPRAARIEFSDVAGGPLSRRQRRGRSAAGLPVRRDGEVVAVANLARDVVRVGTRSTTRIALAILAGRAPKGALESGPVVCSCFAVGPLDVAARDPRRRLVSVEQIGKALRAGTNCGSCIPELKGSARRSHSRLQ